VLVLVVRCGACVRTCVRTYVHACMRACVRVCVRACACGRVFCCSVLVTLWVCVDGVCKHMHDYVSVYEKEVECLCVFACVLRVHA